MKMDGLKYDKESSELILPYISQIVTNHSLSKNNDEKLLPFTPHSKNNDDYTFKSLITALRTIYSEICD